MAAVELEKLFGEYTIARLPVLAPIPSWSDGPGFVSISRGDDELSVICLRERVPATVKTEGEWVCFKVIGPVILTAAGITLSVMRPVSENSIGVLTVSTFNGNYLLVRDGDIAAATDFLFAAGRCVA